MEEATSELSKRRSHPGQKAIKTEGQREAREQELVGEL